LKETSAGRDEKRFTDKPNYMGNLRELRKRINIRSPLTFDEPMSKHTSFRIGGPADAFVRPESIDELEAITGLARENSVPCFALGSGSNILVADEGIEGLVIDLGGIAGIEVSGEDVLAKSGSLISDVSETAYGHSLAGMEFIYSMPGTVGGAIWMNARCYGASVSDVLESVTCLCEDGNVSTIRVGPPDFGYKSSPFQSTSAIILEARFSLSRGNTWRIRALMESRKADRERKGHFMAPSAGSVFKNNRNFGKSTGEIIDAVGLRGHAEGGARISPRHANIIINDGHASARDVLTLMQHVEKRVLEEFGFRLEREIILVGKWDTRAKPRLD
jgi:UDP-N-acetylmuramate dehydrogenase